MKNLLLIALALLPFASFAKAAEPQPKPNIIVFLVDDMGWQDTSVPFWTSVTPNNKKFHTPNMEALASEGMKFTQAYACCVCSPSRVSMITGLNAARHRVTNWTMKKDKTTDAPNPRLILPAWNFNGINPTPGMEHTVVAKCLPQFLHEAGYRTIHVGKAHFGASDTPGADPLNLGFDVNIGGHAAGGPGSYLAEAGYSAVTPKGGDHYWDIPGLDKYHGTHTFLTEALTIEAMKAVDNAVADKKPFYLYLAHYAVHVPYAPDDRFIQKYRDAGLGKNEAMYAALIEGMDKSLGDVMTHLKDLHLDQNTILLFMSDNGGLSAHGRDGKPHTHNLPLSSGKGSAHEGGLREPMIVRWPGTVKPGSTCNTPIIIEDFFPSILDMAGVKDYQQVGGHIDGISFIPLLQGQEQPDYTREFIWHYPNDWGPTGPGLGPFSAIRKGDWKYIFYYDPTHNPRAELFNIKDDIGESKNLAATMPEKVKELAAALRTHLTEEGAQIPKDKKTGKTIEIP